MGKQGPCCHCGISTTPLWRNGPPEKPVLCNACGSRWKTKGTLLNYMPMHSGGFGVNAQNATDTKWPRGRKGSYKQAEQRSHKRKEPCDGQFRVDQSFAKVHVEEAVSKSCSGSGISGGDGPIRHKQLSRTASGPPWDGPVPSKKRSAIQRLPKPVEQLTRSFGSTVLDPASVAYGVRSSSMDALLSESNSNPSFAAVEVTGLCDVLGRPPVPVAQESELGTTSSFHPPRIRPSEPFHMLGGYSELPGALSLDQDVNVTERGSAVRGKEKAKQVPKEAGAGPLQNEKISIPNKAFLENFPYNKRDVLQSSQSPLAFLELKDIVNYDTFTGLLTAQEQYQLMPLVSSADVTRIPESLKCMFSSTQFEAALANYQHLLSEGMFDPSEPGLGPRILHHYQQLLTLTDLAGSGWMERSSQLQHRTRRRGSLDCIKVTQMKELVKDKMKGQSISSSVGSVCSGEKQLQQLSSRPQDRIEEDYKLTKTSSFTGSSSTVPSVFHNANLTKNIMFVKPELEMPSLYAAEMEPLGKNEGNNLLGNSLFNSADEKDTILGDEYLSMGDMDPGEGDSLLFDVPNPMSFHHAELLQQPSQTRPAYPKEEENDATQLESGSLIMNNASHIDPAEPSLFWNSSFMAPPQALPNGTILNPGRRLQ